jgi:hypothetical protein
MRRAHTLSGSPVDLLEAGERVDKRCRWIFSLAYLGSIALLTAAAFIFF